MSTFPCRSGDGLDLGPAEGREAVHDCDADLDFGGLACGIKGLDPLAEKRQAVHLSFYPTSDMVSCSLLPWRPSEAPRRPQDLISCQRGGAVFLPGAAVSADRYNRIGAVRDDRSVTASRVIGAISGDGGDLFILGKLREQLGSQRAVSRTARGELDCLYVAGLRVHGDVDLPPLPTAGGTMLAGQPFIRWAYAAALQPRSHLIHPGTSPRCCR